MTRCDEAHINYIVISLHRPDIKGPYLPLEKVADTAL